METNSLDNLPTVRDELDLLDELVDLNEQRIIELGCGNARLARSLVQRYAGSQVVGLEVDEIQHGKNMADPQYGMVFMAGVAQEIPFPDASFDGAMMLKSLHHVPMDVMDDALDEVARVLKPGAWFYVSEPVYAGSLNDIIRLYNDEGTVRAAAQAALDRALTRGRWEAADERRFAQHARFKDWAEFSQRMLYPTFADHRVTPELEARVRAAFEPHMTAEGAHFVRAMHVRLLRRKGA